MQTFEIRTPAMQTVQDKTALHMKLNTKLQKKKVGD
uniref:Uncharacterized protein n=1 Tax=Arundo donax TaxID=35708 RepID=A0A0A9FTZ5_ARUDO